MTLPVDFEALARGAKKASGGGYPVQISAADLQKNFVFAALDADASLLETVTGPGGHSARKLRLPAVPAVTTPQVLTASAGDLSWAEGIPPAPTSGTHVLGCVNGELQWIATEEC